MRLPLNGLKFHNRPIVRLPRSGPMFAAMEFLHDVETITLPDTGHFSALERPTEIAHILLRRAGTKAVVGA